VPAIGPASAPSSRQIHTRTPSADFKFNARFWPSGDTENCAGLVEKEAPGGRLIVACVSRYRLQGTENHAPTDARMNRATTPTIGFFFNASR
jgi:hypothetical protein